MEGSDPNRVVLVYSRLDISGTNPRHLVGSGYFITNDIVLTAYHVLSEGRPTELKVRAPNMKKFINAEPEPVWASDKIDAALIRVTKPLDGRVNPPHWGETLGKDEDVEWRTVAYPVASTAETLDHIKRLSNDQRGKQLEGGAPITPSAPQRYAAVSVRPVCLIIKPPMQLSAFLYLSCSWLCSFAEGPQVPIFSLPTSRK